MDLLKFHFFFVSGTYDTTSQNSSRQACETVYTNNVDAAESKIVSTCSLEDTVV